MKFKQIGAPQPNDIITASARDASQSFDDINKEILPFFKETADELISKYSAEEVICRALAIISGYTKNLKQKSLLNSTEGMVTMKLTGSIEGISGGTYNVFRLLKNNLDRGLVDTIKVMKVIKNDEGVVFDIPDKYKEAFIEEAHSLKKRSNLELEVCEELPELKEVGYNNFNGNRNYSNGRFNNFSRGGGSGSGGRFNNSGYSRNNSNYRGGNGYGNNKGYQNSYNRDAQQPQRRFFNSNHQQNETNGWGKHQNSSNGKVDQKKIFVGNLPYEFNPGQFKDWIKSRKINPIDSYLVKDHEGKCKGFGYIKFADEKDAQTAYRTLGNSYIDDRRVKIDFATERS